MPETTPSQDAAAKIKAEADAKAKAAEKADTAAREAYTPYTGTNEIVEGGQYMRGTKLVKNKHMGGEIVNAHGEILATFDEDEENDGNPASGHKPKK